MITPDEVIHLPSRVVVTRGSNFKCACCLEVIRFKRGLRTFLIRYRIKAEIKHYHDDCYRRMKMPFGTPVESGYAQSSGITEEKTA